MKHKGVTYFVEGQWAVLKIKQLVTGSIHQKLVKQLMAMHDLGYSKINVCITAPWSENGNKIVNNYRKEAELFKQYFPMVLVTINQV